MLPWIIGGISVLLFVLIIVICWDEFNDNDSRGGMP